MFALRRVLVFHRSLLGGRLGFAIRKGGLEGAGQVGDEVVGGAVRLERAGERRIELGGFQGIHEAGLGGGFDQAVRSDPAGPRDGECTGQEERDGAEILGDDVVLLRHRVLAESGNGEAEAVPAELGGQRRVGQHHAGLKSDAPRGKQRGQGGGGRTRLLAHHWISARAGHLRRHGIRVEAGNHGASIE